MLKRLFGSGSDKPKSVRLGVNAYGKLPIYKDFISCGMTDAPAREFRVWIDKGFSHRWSTDDSTAGAEIPPYSFLMRLPDSRGCAAGSLWGSSDEGGLRKFPFALFLSFPKDHGAADPVAAIEYLGEIERRASELRFLFGPGASLSSFYQTYRGNEIDVLLRPRADITKELRAELADFSIAEFAESLFGDASVSLWPQLLDSATSLVQSGQASVLRLPLSGRLPRAREVEFWLFWLERLDPKGKRPLMGVLYPHGHNPGRVVFFFRELKPEDFLLLHPTRSNLPSVGEAVSGVAGGEEALAGARRRGARATPAAPEVEPAKTVEPAAPVAPPAPEGPPEPPPAAALSLATPAPASPETSPEPEAARRFEPREAEPSVPEPEVPSEPALPMAPEEPTPAVGPAEPPAPAAAAAASEAPAEAAAPAPAAPEAPVPEPPAVLAAAPSELETEIASDASPFPEADAPPETTAGTRLSRILALDPNGTGVMTAVTAGDAEQGAPPSPPETRALDDAPDSGTPPVATRFLEEPEFEIPVPVAASPSESVASESVPSESFPSEPVPSESFPSEPGLSESVTEPPTAAAPSIPVPAVPVIPAEPVVPPEPPRLETARPAPTPVPPEPAAPAPPPRPEHPAPPAAWNRPLPSLLDG